jgi:isopenicillin-N epimerase
MIKYGRPIRSRFLLERGTDFLNHGSFGATPRTVLASAERWRQRMEAHPDRFLRYERPHLLRAAAGILARFVRAKEQDIVFVENATSGINAVLRSLELRPGDEILTTTHVYNAVRQTIRDVCSRSGAKLVEVPIDLPVADSEGLIRPLKKALNRRTRLVVLDHIASPTGLIFPVKRIAALARARGAKVLVDGAHAPGQLDLDIPALGADWYSGNCHKWLFAPKGCGFLWARRKAQEGIHPPVISHGYRKGFTEEFDWTGTRDFSAWLSVPDGIHFFRKLRPARLRAYCHNLVVREARKICAAWGTELDGPPELHGTMIAIRLPDRLQGRDPVALMADWMDRHRIVVPTMAVGGVFWMRISAQVYNAPGDYDRLRELVARS